MKIKRIFPLFLAIVMVLSTVVAVPLGVSAEPTVAEAATGADESTAGYQPSAVVEITAETIEAEGATSVTMTQFAAGSTDAKYVSISNADELVLFSDYSNISGVTWGGKVVYLTNDIDMGGKTMYPIAFRTQADATYVNAVAFRGTFDGQGHTISDLDMTMNSLTDVLAAVEERWDKDYTNVSGGTATATSVNGWGLFCYLDSDGNGNAATIKNVVLDEKCYFETVQNGAYSGTGSIVGTVKHADVRVTNCYSAATVIDCSTGSAGGFVGRGEAKITASNLTFEGNVTAGNHAGGIMGYNSGFDISNSVSNGVVTSKNIHAGGFAARLDSTGVITNSVNSSELVIDVDNATVYMAGFVAKVRRGANLTLTNVTNYSTNMHFAEGRGIVGRLLTDNFYNLAVTGTAIGYQQTAAQVTLSCTNCKGVQLNAGFDGNLIKPLTGGTEITTETTATDFATGNLFYISSPEAFAHFAELINTNTTGTASIVNGKTVYLTADLDMSGIDWTPIGLRPNGAMNGAMKRADGINFDGQGHVISNLICSPTYAESAAIGLFGAAYSGIIRNIIVDQSCAFIAGNYYRTTTNNTQSAGAILGYNGGVTVANCLNMASVHAFKAGGITGGGPANSTYNGAYFCTNAGTVQGWYQAAGINGGIDDGACAMNCLNIGTVVCSGGASWAAGITNGARGGHQIRNNVNYGTVVSNNANFTAGIINLGNNGANTYHMEIRGNYNYGSVARSHNSIWAYEGGVVSFPTTSATNAGNDTIDDLFEKVQAGTQLFTIWDNHNIAPTTVGYSEYMMAPVDLTNVADITDLYMIYSYMQWDDDLGEEVPVGEIILKSGAKETPFMKITDAEGMRLLSAMVFFGNNLEGKTIYLANDIDMSSLKFNLEDTLFEQNDTFFPIGWYDGKDVTTPTPVSSDNEAGTTLNTRYFSGHFNGLGHKIYNWKIDQEEVVAGGNGLRVGLFGLCYDAIIENLVFDDSNVITDGADVGEGRWTGVVVEATRSTINNVWNKASWDYLAKDSGTTGGILAYGTLSCVVNSTNDGNLDNIRGAGGIIGWSANSCGIVACRNNGQIKSTYSAAAEKTLEYNQVGGLVGRIGGKGNIWNQAGYARVTRIEHCINNGEVSSVGTQAGSLAGYSITFNQLRVFNTVDLANGDRVTLGGNGSTPKLCDYHTPLENGGQDLVMQEMLRTRFQVNEDGSVRLITTIDQLRYAEVGFIIGSEDAEEPVALDTVYSSVLAGEDTLTADQINWLTAKYIAVHTIDEVTDMITVKAYVKTLGGQTIYGNEIAIFPEDLTAPEEGGEGGLIPVQSSDEGGASSETPVQSSDEGGMTPAQSSEEGGKTPAQSSEESGKTPAQSSEEG